MEAKKVLALVARINCKPPLSGKLVTQEEKEQMLEESNQPFSSIEHAEQSFVGSENYCNEINTDSACNITKPNEEKRNDTELILVSSEISATSNGYVCECNQTLNWKYYVKNNATKYCNWFLILFKNGYWRITILLWYLW